MSDGLADVSLCLSLIRRRAAVGDTVLVMSAAAPRFPRAYVAAASAASAEGAPAVVSVLRVSEKVTLREFSLRFGTEHRDPSRAPPRPTAMYRVVSSSAPGARRGHDGFFYAPRRRARWHNEGDPATPAARAALQDLSGPVLLATSWRAWGVDLAGAPRASPAFAAWLLARRGAMRGGLRASAEAPGDATVFSFLADIVRHTP